MGGKIDVQFVKIFILAALETLKIQCSRTFRAGTPHARGQHELQVDIAGVIGLTSKTFNGSIALEFPEKTFLYIMNGMLGEEFTTIDDDLQDGAGELLNIIFGLAKRNLNAKGYEIEKAIPAVVRGSDIKISHKSISPPIIVPFESEHGSFIIEIVLE